MLVPNRYLSLHPQMHDPPPPHRPQTPIQIQRHLIHLHLPTRSDRQPQIQRRLVPRPLPHPAWGGRPRAEAETPAGPEPEAV